LILKTSVNHGVHGEHGGKTRAYAGQSGHPLGEFEEKSETKVFRSAAVFAVVNFFFQVDRTGAVS